MKAPESQTATCLAYVSANAYSSSFFCFFVFLLLSTYCRGSDSIRRPTKILCTSGYPVCDKTLSLSPLHPPPA